LNQPLTNTVNNEAAAIGLFVPGEPGGPDIYGHDNYPGGWNCSDPYNWTQSDLHTDFRQLHLEQSPNTPYSILEFQGGAIDSWGGPGLEGCAAFINSEFTRVFYKNNFGNGITIFNQYMMYGGTNWGNIGQSGGYTSYDYGAAIMEDRTLFREKYHEAKLIAQFMVSSPAYLDATPGNLTNSSYASTSAITTTPIFSDVTNFYVVRHSDYTSLSSTPYTFTVPTKSMGNVTIPQLGGALTLNGRDSKTMVSTYSKPRSRVPLLIGRSSGHRLRCKRHQPYLLFRRHLHAWYRWCQASLDRLRPCRRDP
jgi:hypothetical protein